MRFIFGIIMTLGLLLASCREDINFETTDASALRFSQDTLVLDTVYSQVRSETYAFKVYNDSDKDIKIPQITLEKGQNSMYKINVDGQSGVSFQNIPLRKKDSLYVFVEVAPVANAPEALEIDRVLFGNASKGVTLMSVVQDAEFFVSTKDQPKTIDQNTIWTHNKAKIIMGELSVAEGKTLTIEQGTKVYFYKDSGLKISKNAVLKVNGDYKKEVLFRGEKNSPKYDTIPANWNGIRLEEGALAEINYAKIFGGNTGLKLNHAKANLKNTIIHTFQDYGIFGNNADLKAENLVVNNCGQSNIGIVKGGNYELLHATLVNYFSMGSVQGSLGIEAANEWKDGDQPATYAPLNLTLKNSIVYNKTDNAIVLKPTSGQVFDYQFQNILTKYSAKDAGYAWDSNPNITQSIKNEDPLFIHRFIEKMNLRLQPQSPARGKGNNVVAQQVPLDITKVSRLNQPNLGAYQE
ncbi:hypothetical protein [Riemerella columbina]|uniref:hypothetical protein n=1 Tax=Riemerella columbina TaxID=103810 RepID=UPI00036FE6D6|nr:hypothetical protein [Riemerella columbina]